jgi:hypothetical protein
VSAIAAASSYAYGAVASLLSNAASLATTDASKPAANSTTTDPAASSAADPVDSVDISDHAKATLARAKADQVAANTLTAQLAAARDPEGKDPAPQKSSDDITTSFDRLAGISAADDTAPSGVTTPDVNFSGGFRAGGYTIAAKGSASTWSSEIDIIGPNGFSFMDKAFGAGVGMGTSEFAGGSSGSGMSTTMQKEGNQEYITVSDASAATSAVATGNSVQSAANSQASSTTFVVDFSTGQISMIQADTSSAAASTAVR